MLKMIRKIILMGGKTHVVSLPANWVRRLNLSKGQEVNIEENDNQLRITANLHPESKSIAIDYHPNKLLKAYQMGFDEIKIHSTNIKEIQTIISEFFIGFEIIQSQASYCVIKSISEINPEELNNIIKRALLVLASENSSDRNHGLKLIYASKRIINRYGQKYFNKSLILYNLLSKIEQSTNTSELYSIYGTYQKYEANKFNIKDDSCDNLTGNLQEEMISLALC